MTEEKAIFAGGCFWCMVKPFDQMPGIKKVVSGYTGGHVPNPTYEEVCSGTTGHTEAVEITFDPAVISYQELVEIYWQQTDPTDAFGQFADRGDSYRPVIFYASPEQKETAEASKEQLQDSGRFKEPIVTAIEPAQVFYPAEEYHQDFYRKNPEHYTAYSEGSGRRGFIRQNWDA
ncbi:peptide-methionine (S)-S-oxide reductase MsrA [Enterococcus gilvus]|uniref:peptide-methionine (S)-S-oxide reductase MsrA n=1 Tax=Enterococcus gilvus TaxID=160453 RepID=UPI001C8BACD7|nr:peptide-methionine (S)-S-oxide reductase MsrA [Enterococcus gilvus]MBX8937131.1 peptide-methionine (S)-S-oxide reductase MsrA [Enterococcus gilvus]